MNTPSVQHTRTRGQFVPGCVCPVGVHPLLSTVTASPGLCTTAEQIFVRSGANRQGAVREPGWEGRPGQAQRSGTLQIRWGPPGNILEIMLLRHTPLRPTEH